MDILHRLKNYNPPDRTVNSEREISQDIWDAKEEIQSLQKSLSEANERKKYIAKRFESIRQTFVENGKLLKKKMVSLSEAQQTNSLLQTKIEILGKIKVEAQDKLENVFDGIADYLCGNAKIKDLINLLPKGDFTPTPEAP